MVQRSKLYIKIHSVINSLTPVFIPSTHSRSPNLYFHFLLLSQYRSKHTSHNYVSLFSLCVTQRSYAFSQRSRHSLIFIFFPFYFFYTHIQAFKQESLTFRHSRNDSLQISVLQKIMFFSISIHFSQHLLLTNFKPSVKLGKRYNEQLSTLHLDLAIGFPFLPVCSLFLCLSVCLFITFIFDRESNG